MAPVSRALPPGLQYLAGILGRRGEEVADAALRDLEPKRHGGTAHDFQAGRDGNVTLLETPTPGETNVGSQLMQRIVEAGWNLISIAVEILT